MPTAHSLVAPTQKMSDDTPYRQSGPQAQATPYSIPPQNNSIPPQNNSFPPHNNSIPPQNSFAPHPSQPPLMPEPIRSVTTRPGPGAPPQAPRGSTPPAGHSMPPQRPKSSPQRAQTAPAARAQTPAESLAPPPTGRRWGLIIFVLLIDIGLAASGAWMLSQGLAN